MHPVRRKNKVIQDFLKSENMSPLCKRRQRAEAPGSSGEGAAGEAQSSGERVTSTNQGMHPCRPFTKQEEGALGERGDLLGPRGPWA